MNPFLFCPAEILADSELTKIELRVLLALYSFRNRDTNLTCPKRETIARRLGYQKVQTISEATSSLVCKGWLTKIGSGGYSRSVTYQVHVPQRLIQNGDRTDHGFSGRVPESGTPRVPESGTPRVPESGTPRVPESGTGNKQNKSTEKINRRHQQQTAGAVAVADVVNLYHEILPNHPKVVKLTDKRAGLIRARISEDKMNADRWRDFFRLVLDSRWLCENARRFDLEWLVRPNNFAKVLEGKYANRAGAVVVDAGVTPEDVVNLYHECLPEHPPVSRLTDERRALIMARVRDDGLITPEKWRVFFDRVKSMKFLAGNSRINLEWLTAESNFLNVNEGKYADGVDEDDTPRAGYHREITSIYDTDPEWARQYHESHGRKPLEASPDALNGNSIFADVARKLKARNENRKSSTGRNLSAS